LILRKKIISRVLVFSLAVLRIFFASLVEAQFYTLTEVGSLSFDGEAFDIKVDSEIAYITVMGENKLKIVDVSNPFNPLELGFFQAQNIHNVFIEGSIAFLCDFSSGLLILNTSMPSNPTLITTFITGGAAWDVQIVEDTAFIADFDSGLIMLNISDKNHPTELGRIAGRCSSVKVASSQAYVLDFDLGLRIIDVSDQTNPVEIGIYNNGAPFQTVNTYNNLVYVSDWDEGVKIIDVSDPSDPKKIGSFNKAGKTDSVYLMNDIAYVAAWENGVKLFNISDSSKLEEVGQFNDGGKVGKTFVVEDTIYAADQNDGLEVLRMEIDPSKTASIPFYFTLLVIVIIQSIRINRKKSIK
jgi:hypothetical protein